MGRFLVLQECSPFVIDTALSGERTLDIQLVADVFNATTFLQEECFVQ